MITSLIETKLDVLVFIDARLVQLKIESLAKGFELPFFNYKTIFGLADAAYACMKGHF